MPPPPPSPGLDTGDESDEVPGTDDGKESDESDDDDSSDDESQTAGDDRVKRAPGHGEAIAISGPVSLRDRESTDADIRLGQEVRANEEKLREKAQAKVAKEAKRKAKEKAKRKAEQTKETGRKKRKTASQGGVIVLRSGPRAGQRIATGKRAKAVEPAPGQKQALSVTHGTKKRPLEMTGPSLPALSRLTLTHRTLR